MYNLIHFKKWGLFPNGMTGLYQRMGWRPVCLYFNTGVLFFSNFEGRDAFFKEWNRLWESALRDSNSHYDQPIFNRVAATRRLKIRRVRWRCNAYVGAPDAIRVRGIRLAHYFASGRRPPRVLDSLFPVQEISNTAFSEALEKLSASDGKGFYRPVVNRLWAGVRLLFEMSKK